MFKFIVLICLVFLVVSNEAAFKIGKKTCSPDKLVPGPEFNAVKEVLEIVKKEKIGDFHSSTVAGQKVWAQAKCLAPGDCRECVKKLADRVWKACKNAKGATVNAGDCWLRYEFFEF